MVEDTAPLRSRLEDILKFSCEQKATDIHFTPEVRPEIRMGGKMRKLKGEPISRDEVVSYAEKLLTPEQKKIYKAGKDVDFGVTYQDVRLRGRLSRGDCGEYMSLRTLPDEIIPLGSLGFPNDVYKDIVDLESGLVLVTGVTGSGKSTTLSSLIDRIRDSGRRILTVEDPIEYIHKPDDKRGTVIQREVPVHTPRFHDALRGFLREDPDVVMVGEMRDCETAIIALNAADTGHLVLSTLHTSSAADTISRIVGMAPPDGSSSTFPVTATLASTLRYVLSQKLCPRTQRKIETDLHKRNVALAMEVLKNTSAVRHKIDRFSKEGDKAVSAINTAIQTGRDDNMIPFDEHLKELYHAEEISLQTVVKKANNRSAIEAWAKKQQAAA